MEEGREKVTAKGDVTRIVVSGSRTSEMEAELLSADVDDRRGTRRRSNCGEWVHSEGNGGVHQKRSRKKKIIGG